MTHPWNLTQNMGLHNILYSFISFDTGKSWICLKLPRTFQIPWKSGQIRGDCTRSLIIASDCDKSPPIKTWGNAQSALLFLLCQPDTERGTFVNLLVLFHNWHLCNCPVSLSPVDCTHILWSYFFHISSLQISILLNLTHFLLYRNLYLFILY